MKKRVAKIILTLLILAMAVSVFVACETRDTYSVSFVSEDGVATDAMTAEQAKEYLASLPSREGYVFKGWYLDKDVWEQEIKSTEDIEKYIVSGNVNVYARWIPIVDAITILFLDYNKASLLEYRCDRSDADLTFLKPSEKPNDEKYTYTFDHWDCDLSDLTQGYYTATPVYRADLRVFEVKYYDEGKLIYTEKVKYGEDAYSSRVKPEKKPSTAKYDYTFVGWDGVSTNITADVNLNAMYQESIRQYNVEFNYGDGKKEIKKVNYGEAAVAPQNTAKSDTAQYKYDFVGWDNVFDNIQKDTVVNAKYTQQTQIYEVSFWIDDKCIQSSKEKYGADVTAPSPVVKVENDGYIYEFTGWSENFNFITRNTRVNAIFNRKAQTFQVKYVDWDGTLLYTDEVETGEESVYGGETPKRASNPRVEYAFIGWSDSDKLKDVRESFKVDALYREDIRRYKVQFNYGDGEQKVSYVYYNEAATAPQNVEKSDTAQYRYTFVGWDNIFDNIQSDTVVNAVYSEQIQVYEVSFYAGNKCIQSTIEKYGASVTAPSKVIYNPGDGFVYVFTGWDNEDYVNIQGKTVVNAIFDKQSQSYEIRYVDWNGDLLYLDTVQSGNASTYKGETPQRASNPQNEYEFRGWVDENNNDATEKLGNVTETFEVYADYDAIIRKYTVTFAYGDDQTYVIENVPYGSNIIGQEPVDTKKTSTAKYDFTFIGWQGYLGYVSSDMTVNALYSDTIRKYLVKFVNDGEVIRAQEVAYEDYPSAPNVVPMANNVQYNYTFEGWGLVENPFISEGDVFEPIDVEQTIVTGEITYTAVYLRKIQQYVITFFNEQVLGNRIEVGKITVDYGTDATSLAPIVTRDKTQSHEYTFVKWSKDITNISAHVEVDAMYSQALRKYMVVYLNDVSDSDESVYQEYYREEVEYGGSVKNKPENPLRKSTVGFDYEFSQWGKGVDDSKFSDEDNVLGDTEIYAKYDSLRRKYRVTFFDLSMYELISSVELYYGEKISSGIERDGYYFDAWYRDPDCTVMFNTDTESVDGIMMLFGNTVLNGIEYSGDTVTGYSGEITNVILPRVIQGTRMKKIKDKAFADNAVMESVYIPDTYSNVGACVFANIAELDIYTQVKGLGVLDYPAGWNSFWNSNNYLIGTGSSGRPVTNNVENVVTSGDYRYILIASDKNTAIINKFVNNNAARAYIKSELNYKKPSFNYVENVDEKTGQTRNIYTISYEKEIYDINTISQSAFQGCENLGSIFIPNTITTIKKYAFSGITANLYIQYDSRPSGFHALYWNSNRDSKDESKRTVYWGVIGMDQIGDFTYIFKNDRTAIAAEYNGSTSLGSVTIPDTVSYRESSESTVTVDYTVTELGDELFATGMMSLISFWSIKLPANLKKIGNKVFYMNKSLSSIELPATLEEIGDYAFVGAMGLKEIFIPASIEKIGMFCFAGSNATIYVGRSEPKLPTDKPTRGLYWNIKLDIADIQKLTSVSGFLGLVFSPKYLPTYWNVAGQYTDVATEMGGKTNFTYMLYNDSTASLVSYKPLPLNVANYRIPETITVDDKTYTVTEIKDNAFNGNTELKTVYIPSTVTKVGVNAFAGCKNLTINTAFAEGQLPNGWDSSFNPDNRPINYGVQ